MKINFKRNKRLWTILGLVAIVIVFIAINGKPLLSKLGVTSKSGISLYVPVSGSTVFMDGKRLQVTDKNNQIVNIKGFSLTGLHTIIVSKDGYWPWSKEITAKPDKKLVLGALTSSQKPAITPVTATTGDYAAAVAALKTAAAPGKEKMKLSRDGLVGIWVADGDIYAAWQPKGTPDDFFCLEDLCTKTIRVFKGSAPISSIAFYKNREDVVLFSSGGSIYAIEIDRKGTQNFQPIFKGTNPIFGTTDSDVVYVQDGGKIFKVAL